MRSSTPPRRRGGEAAAVPPAVPAAVGRNYWPAQGRDADSKRHHCADRARDAEQNRRRQWGEEAAGGKKIHLKCDLNVVVLSFRPTAVSPIQPRGSTTFTEWKVR